MKKISRTKASRRRGPKIRSRTRSGARRSSRPTPIPSPTRPATTHEVDADVAQSHWDVRRSAIEIEIERATLELCRRRGIDGVTTEEIAEAAGISRRTFFRYFQSRDDLLAAAPARFLIRSLQALRERPRHESIVDALLATARSGIYSDEEAEIMQLSAGVMARSPEAWITALGPLRRATDELFGEAVAYRLRLANQSEAHADVVAAGLAAVVVRAYWRWVAAGCAGEFADRLQQGLEKFIEVVGARRRR